MTNSGYVNVSTPELTAFDLIVYAKNIGGMNRVATVLSELAEAMNFEKSEVDFFKLFSNAAIQRLGYLLELLGFNDLSDILEEKSKQAGIKFKKYPLSAVAKGANLSGYPIDDKWKIIINTPIEIGEL
jgi:predicted transcriptional regulator of viral defense system